ncbi:hypothetical protein AC629_31060 [Bradyrhizobium sp. NAS80.1]|nr:hypothetical protein AC629_31060 [Bradyrhizobium sp. NAS80.1]
MGERGEAPGSMGGVIRYESLLASALWHSASPKKAPDAPNPWRAGEGQFDRIVLVEMFEPDGTEWGVSQYRMKTSE